MIQNPVLQGFHPDPSMICVDGTFYIANSTFEYFPGVEISASKDLANFTMVSRPLDSLAALDMRGNYTASGIWAPNLTYKDGTYYLVFTDVKTCAVPPFKDTPNYITTTTDIENGSWTEPKFVNASGFDPSLFHDSDGRLYFLNMQVDFRLPGVKQFSGILLTELNPTTFAPISEPINICKGSHFGVTEGPNLYKRGEYYYLFLAEGGTGYGHATTVARSKSIAGPYEFHPDVAVVTSVHDDKYPLQKAGHSAICDGPDGRSFIASLASRPLANMRCPLGRETVISELVWKEDDWCYLKSGKQTPDLTFTGYGEQREETSFTYKFDTDECLPLLSTLRQPAQYEIAEGKLRLFGGMSPYSAFSQNMFMRKQTDFDFDCSTELTLCGNHFQKFAGLMHRYNEKTFFYAILTYDEVQKCKIVQTMFVDHGKMTLGKSVAVATDTVQFKTVVRGKKGQFYYSTNGKKWHKLGKSYDASKLSDDYSDPGGFTGAHVGIACSDLQDYSAYADFTFLQYTVALK